MPKGKLVTKVLRRDALPVPQNLPDGIRCVQVSIPDDDEYLVQFYSILTLLTKWNSYHQDGFHKAADVAQLWREVLKISVCEFSDTNSGILLEDLMSQQIRISPDDSCILQMWCIDHWEDWYDPRTCVAGTIAQPTNGSPLDFGECREWEVLLNGNDKWLLPIPVSENYLINVTSASGAWNDNTLGWNCANGKEYLLGGCTADDPAQIGDPLSSVNHMCLIMNVDGDWFNGYNTVFAVPSGITDAPVYFQANDGTLEDNSGSISFHIRVCRQEPVATPIGITYPFGLGIGPSEVNSGDTFNVSAVDNGGGGHNFYVDMEFTREVKVSVLSVGSYVLASGFAPGTIFGQIKNTGGGVLQQLVVGTNTSPIEYTPQENVKHFDCGAGNNVWVITVKVEDF